MLRYVRQIKPGIVAFYDIWPGNGACLFLQPGAHTRHLHNYYHYICQWLM